MDKKLTLTLTNQAVEILDGLVLDMGRTEVEVIALSIILMRIAVDARKQGKSLGVALTDSDLEFQIVGV